MRIEFTYARPADYFHRQFRDRARKFFVSSIVGAAILALVSATAVALSHDTVTDIVVDLSFLAVGGIIAYIAHWQLGQVPVFPASFQAPRRWLITDEGLESATELTAVAYDWSAFRSFTARPNAFLLWQHDGILIDIPRAPLTADEDTAVGAFLAAADLGRAGTARVDVPAIPPSAMRLELTSSRPPQYLDGPALPGAQPTLRSPRRWTITEDVLRVTDSGKTQTWRWTAVTAVTVRPHLYLFQHDPAAAGFDLPRQALSTAQEAELRTFLTRRGLLRDATDQAR